MVVALDRVEWLEQRIVYTLAVSQIGRMMMMMMVYRYTNTT